jgi:hypothetical protein
VQKIAFLMANISSGRPFVYIFEHVVPSFDWNNLINCKEGAIFVFHGTH